MATPWKILAELRCQALVGLAPHVAQMAGQVAAHAGLPAERSEYVQLAVEELFVNVCSYAYPDEPGDVWLTIRAGGPRLEFDLGDEGGPFDPLAVAEPGLHASLADRPVGGLGLYLVRNLTDDLRYRRRDGRNELHFGMLLPTAENEAVGGGE
jgi:anti-sigma regulatory factor (Ser/Thr protein kinase)